MKSTMTNSVITHQVFGIQTRFPRRLLSAESNSKHHTSDQLSDSSTKQAGRIGPKITEILKRKLSLGAKILQIGGATKAFNQSFSVLEGEKLVKAFQCYLSTTTGPIAGLLFISTNKVAFCSKKLLEISSPAGEIIKIHYKVSIPLTRIMKARVSKDVNRPSKKYVEIVTRDNFDFWFMGFLNQQRTFKYLSEQSSNLINELEHIPAFYVDNVKRTQTSNLYSSATNIFLG